MPKRKGNTNLSDRPVKKRNGVTAGIAQSADADGHSTGYGRMESHIVRESFPPAISVYRQGSLN